MSKNLKSQQPNLKDKLENPRTQTQVALAAVELVSVLVGTLTANIIEIQMHTYNEMTNKIN